MKRITILLLLITMQSGLFILPMSGGCADCGAASTVSTEGSEGIQTRLLKYKVIDVFPHDREAFTQGLIFYNGVLFESTGKYGRSSVRRTDMKTGEVLRKTDLPGLFFGEGLTYFNDRLIQLTWRSGQGFVYHPDTLELQGEFRYGTEGWGLTHDEKHLILSDGGAKLYFLDPETYRMLHTVDVRDENGPVKELNELEYIRGLIFANIWQTNDIAVIDPETGWVKARLHCTGLLNFNDYVRPVNVLNGIAYLPDSGHLLITGKLWPKMFEIAIDDDDFNWLFSKDTK